tara:strand:- start:513 stop:929 length:417 start_codon:yes stop_codon:yes gene_type:complete
LVRVKVPGLSEHPIQTLWLIYWLRLNDRRVDFGWKWIPVGLELPAPAVDLVKGDSGCCAHIKAPHPAQLRDEGYDFTGLQNRGGKTSILVTKGQTWPVGKLSPVNRYRSVSQFDAYQAVAGIGYSSHCLVRLLACGPR